MQAESNFKDRSHEVAELRREQGKRLRYGTSGIRTRAEVVISISYRIGIATAELAKAYAPNCIGIVITASHNHKRDNGCKIVNDHGHMLRSTEENIVEEFLNAKDINQGYSTMKASIAQHFGDKYK